MFVFVENPSAYSDLNIETRYVFSRDKTLIRVAMPMTAISLINGREEK